MAAVKDLMKDTGFPVEHHEYHAMRQDFRIVELHISPNQEVPWHYHNHVQDTLYVLSGAIRVTVGGPREEVRLAPGQTYTVPCKRPHHIANDGTDTAAFLVLQGIGEYDFSLLPRAPTAQP